MRKEAREKQAFQIVDKIPKRLFVLGFCHPFSVIENPCSLGRPSIGAERMLKDRQKAGLFVFRFFCSEVHN
ncbi:hypothetical protein DI291_13930 [Bacillus paralicheniformis]|nr:hypothetical protein DI291_13930 [Bacillus paralicheniformis]